MKVCAMNTVNMDNANISFNSNLRKSKMDKRTEHELFRRHPDNPILSVNDWPHKANSVFNSASAEVDGKISLLTRLRILEVSRILRLLAAMMVLATGRQQLAENELFAPTDAVRLKRDADVEFGVNEWLRAQGSTPQGEDWQSWSAAMYLYALLVWN